MKLPPRSLTVEQMNEDMELYLWAQNIKIYLDDKPVDNVTAFDIGGWVDVFLAVEGWNSQNITPEWPKERRYGKVEIYKQVEYPDVQSD